MVAPDSSIDRYPSAGALTRAAAAGEHEAQRVLVLRLMERVRATVRYLVADDRDADDMIQLCLVEILSAAGSFREEGRLERWADRITVRTALRLIKRRRRHEAIVSPGLDEDPRGGDGRESASRRQLRRHLARVLVELSAERREVLVLQLVHGYSVTEIAELTEAPLNTVRDRLAKGKKELRKRLLADPIVRDWVELVS